jgi:hypothetical protein
MCLLISVPRSLRKPTRLSEYSSLPLQHLRTHEPALGHKIQTPCFIVIPLWGWSAFAIRRSAIVFSGKIALALPAAHSLTLCAHHGDSGVVQKLSLALVPVREELPCTLLYQLNNRSTYYESVLFLTHPQQKRSLFFDSAILPNKPTKNSTSRTVIRRRHMRQGAL